MPKYVTGLVVGKFAPLHCGHLHLIKKAAFECEKLIVLSYTSEHFEGCEPATRRMWLEKLAKQYSNIEVHVLEDKMIVPDDMDDGEVHREFCAEYLLYELGTTVDAVFTSEQYGDGFSEHLTKYFRAEVNSEVSVKHICVDIARKKYPISGTKMRKAIADNEFRMLFQLPDFVRASFVKKILLLGGESTGKSTLAKSLADWRKTVYVPEYGRELYEKRVRRGGTLRFEDYAEIAETQIQWERMAQFNVTSSIDESKYFVFCDTSPITTLWYSMQWCAQASSALEKFVIESEYSYYKVYICAPDFPFVQDGTRQDETFRLAAHNFYIDYLDDLGIDYKILYGSIEERIQQVLNDLGEK